MKVWKKTFHLSNISISEKSQKTFHLSKKPMEIKKFWKKLHLSRNSTYRGLTKFDCSSKDRVDKTLIDRLRVSTTNVPVNYKHV